MTTNTSRRGRKPRQISDTRTPQQKRKESLERRHAKAIDVLANFDKFPDSARIRQPAVEALLCKSHATIWRDVKNGKLCAPRKDGFATTWSVGQIRAVLKGGAA